MSKSERIKARTVLTDPVNFLAFGFGTGLAPVAPGTFGSIPGLALFWLTQDFGLYVQLGVALALVMAGIWICGESARRIGVHDHGGIVWDEIAGMYLTLFLAPATMTGFLVASCYFGLWILSNPGRFGTWITEYTADWELCWMTSWPPSMPHSYWLCMGG